MKILHVVPSYLPAWRYGGPIRSVHGLARAQAAMGERVEVFTTDADGPDRLDVPSDRPVELDGVSVRYFPCGAPRRLYRSPALGRALEAVAGFDLVHLHSVFLWPTLAAARRARAAGVPYVVSPRGMLIRDLISVRGALRKQLWIRLFERRTLRGAAAIIVTSDYEARELRGLGLALAAVEVVPNGVSLDYGEGDFGDSEALDRFLAGGPYFLFLGRLAAKKSLELLLQALAQAPGARLVVAGGDEDRMTGRLREVVSELGLGDRVWFAGEVRGGTKVRLLAECQALVLPSTSENFGNVVLEALAAGRPAIVSRAVGLAPELERREAGWVFDGGSAELAARISALRENPALATRAGESGRRWVEAELGWDCIATRMREVYRRAVEGRGA